MKDLSNAVTAAMMKMTAEGTIEKILEDQLQKTIKEIVNDQFRSYSDFGKVLKDKIDNELAIDLSSVTFTEYNKTILNLVEGIVNNSVTEETEGKLRQDLLELFEKPPAEIKLSEVINKYIEDCKDDFDAMEREKIALIISEKEHGHVSVALHPTDKQNSYKGGTIDSWHDCDHYFLVRTDKENPDRGKMSIAYDREGLKPMLFMPTCMRGVCRLLYQMYCAGSVVVFDQGFNSDDYDTYYPEPY